ncbi:LON peptidase substrate-binding domain-containing protein (plasmid) [Paracoccus sp. TK19116]|uniref:LON peptidase substrate-binding domain-containing protein n=1 Tax=Paracoccus albicereus TaxID=2922394 RepID=A0ABT1MMR5_9RHOB|nr:LON peptidase substrate-binding domain-containing protein [Paracoccus albicereus]MCQ0969461.1 LON peptidase substrate-binding domain-containing protein [Paracoccus albicereus]
MTGRLRFDLPDRIALFPLPGALLLPRSRLPLQIFEPRYLQMLNDVLKTEHRLIGMVQPIDAKEGEAQALAPIGGAGRVVAFTETDDGRMMISLQAISRFRLTEVEEGFAPYLQGRVEWQDFARDLKGPESDEDFDRGPFLEKLERFMEPRELTTDWDAAADAEDEMLINALSMLLPFDPPEKQALLEAVTLTKRREMLEGLIDYALLSEDSEERLQ